MQLYPRYFLSRFYLFCDRTFPTIGAIILGVIVFYFAVGIILTVVKVEQKKAEHRVEYKQRGKQLMVPR